MDGVAPQLNLLQILQIGEGTARDGINGVACKCAENNFVSVLMKEYNMSITFSPHFLKLIMKLAPPSEDYY